MATTPRGNRSTDITRTGSREYTTHQATAVVAFMRRLPGPLKIEEIAIRMGLGGRTVRAILVERDGIDFVLAGSEDGMFLAASMDDAEGLTRKLESQAKKMLRRVERRRAAAQHLTPRKQSELFR